MPWEGRRGAKRQVLNSGSGAVRVGERGGGGRGRCRMGQLLCKDARKSRVTGTSRL